MKTKLSLILTLLTLCSVSAWAQHNSAFGARGYTVGVEFLGKESISVSADKKLGTYNYKPLFGVNASMENMLSGSTYITEFSFTKSTLDNLVKEPAYEDYFFETGDLFNVGLGWYYGYTINKGKRFQVPIYIGGSLDYFWGGYFKNLSLDIGFKIRAKYYLTERIGLYLGYNPSLGMSMGSQNRGRNKGYADFGVVISPATQKKGYDIIVSRAGDTPSRASDARAMEELFQSGLNNRDSYYKTYGIDNPKRKFVKEAHMISYVKDKGYNVIESNSVTVNSFGDKTYVLYDLVFINPKDYPEYVFKKLDIAYAKVKGQGTFLEAVKKEKYVPLNGSSIVSIRDYDMVLEDHQNVKWTGEFKDGYLHGEGTGFYSTGKIYYIIKGNFNHGLAVSDIEVKTYVPDDKDLVVYPGKMKNTKFSPVSVDVMAQQYENPANSLVKKSLELAMIDYYDRYASHIEEAYAKLKGISVAKQDSFTPDDEVLSFLTLYRTCKYDPKKLIPKAEEMSMVNDVLTMLKWKPRDRYYGVTLRSIFSMFYEWNDDAVSTDRQNLNTAIKLAQKGKQSSKYGFKTFFTDAAKSLDKQKAAFEKEVSAQKKKYDAALDAHRREMGQIQAQMEREIDQERSHAPSGDLVSQALFGGNPYAYEKRGRIQTKNGGHYVEYNVYYNKYGGEYELDCYKIYSASSKLRSLDSKEFKSYDAMVNAILSALR